ncbi:MAG: helix-turn-helix transcriptional regulator [Acidobacteria bacterium]|jgi:transcriptional regulator with XRE-family HTH domain|nr:helix-turn-helix transcriptional regulator [Acidobacteriota bacterium]MBA4182582.1 helix-turn-helix transcriptional regulator [Acidobacteriota bacterium]
MHSVEAKKVGDLLREWRERRRLSQLDLALETDVSQRHLSFIEIGRAKPSREMLLRLSERLDVPLRERNVLLTAGGFSQIFPERPLDDAALAAARLAVDLMLSGLEPNPAFVVDRHWNLIDTNKAANFLLTAVDSSLLESSPVNMLRLCLHPRALAARTINYAEWRKYILEYLSRQIEITADTFLIELLEELKNYPKPKTSKEKLSDKQEDYSRVAVPLRLETEEGEMSFLVTTTIFGTPIDITLSEIAVEVFFPADASTAEIINRVFR